MTDETALPAAKLAEAVRWRVRLAEAGENDLIHRAFEAWLDEDSRHSAALNLVSATWSALDDAAHSGAIMQMRVDALLLAQRSTQDRRSREWMPRRLSLAIVAIFMMLAMAGIVLSLHIAPSPDERIFATGSQERRDFVLPDGSRLALDANSTVNMAYGERWRKLTLEKGQARFQVAKDLLRPFTVDGGMRTVVATGTDFMVEIDDGRMMATLLEGRVLVARRKASMLNRLLDRTEWIDGVSLQPGQQLQETARDGLHLKVDVDLDAATAWQSGKLSFDSRPLYWAVGRVNRYSTRPIVIGAVSIADLPVSGVFNAGDPDSFVRAVSAFLPIKAVRRKDGGFTLLSGHSGSQSPSPPPELGEIEESDRAAN